MKKMTVYISELRILGPNSARNVSQSSAQSRPIKPGPTYNSGVKAKQYTVLYIPLILIDANFPSAHLECFT